MLGLVKKAQSELTEPEFSGRRSYLSAKGYLVIARFSKKIGKRLHSF